ncbi:MAG: translation initiation factor IF-2 [Phycisphaerae bacterium]|nr:translation initiation factor IF-2 [Phycisphaerae bacterium]
MAEKLRIHILSKELGVTSKAIIDKCQAEEVDGITNHMSTVSAGLAETIREWFSDATVKTAVEDQAPVDLEKVRVKRTRKKAASKEATETGEEAIATIDAEEESATSAVAPTVEVEESAEPTQEVVTPVDATITQSIVEVPAAQAAALTTETPAETSAPAAAGKGKKRTPPAKAPAAPPPEPKREPVKPAGPQNIPAKVQMRGPQIVGFAKPDPVRPPAPRGPRFAPPPISEPETERRGPGRGKHGGAAATDDAGKKRARVSPRRSGRSLKETGERLREWNERDILERQERLQAASGQGHTRRAREAAPGVSRAAAVIAPRKTKAQVSEPIIVHELCAATGIGMQQMWPKFKNEHNMVIARNTVIPAEIAQVVLLEFGVELEVVKPKTELEKVADEFAARERKHLQRRPPVVTILGHVDHGKTSLLDAIRKTSVAAGEAGGITQHIGAYQVEHGDLKVTFLDTPGHEAFTAMRARGAHMTDVVVLVVAADDGLMPQTIEAINHAKAAKVPVVVALNKIDLPGVDTNKIYGQLAEHQLVPSEWGGDTDVIKTSATKGIGIDELIAHLSTLSDLLELKADPTLTATGAVVEAQMLPGVGPMARVLVQEGTLKTGDFILCGPGAGRVRTLKNDRGKVVQKAPPGMPVEVSGLDEVPNAGDKFYVLKSLQQAKMVAESVKNERRQQTLTQLRKPTSLEDLFAQRESGKRPELNLILRSDVSGSVDAILKALGDIPDEEVKLNILHTGIGSISESDVVLAEASDAIIVGFNVSAETGAQKEADANGVDLRLYRIIYDVVNDIRKALEGLLAPNITEKTHGKADVREIFHVSRVGTIAGCLVTDGTINRSNNVRVVRDGQIIVPTADDVKYKRHRPIGSLKRFKDDAREVRAGMECGIRVEGFDDLKPGDVIEAYEVIEEARTLQDRKQ